MRLHLQAMHLDSGTDCNDAWKSPNNQRSLTILLEGLNACMSIRGWSAWATSGIMTVFLASSKRGQGREDSLDEAVALRSSRGVLLQVDYIDVTKWLKNLHEVWLLYEQLLS